MNREHYASTIHHLPSSIRYPLSAIRYPLSSLFRVFTGSCQRTFTVPDSGGKWLDTFSRFSGWVFRANGPFHISLGQRPRSRQMETQIIEETACAASGCGLLGTGHAREQPPPPEAILLDGASARRVRGWWSASWCSGRMSRAARWLGAQRQPAGCEWRRGSDVGPRLPRHDPEMNRNIILCPVRGRNQRGVRARRKPRAVVLHAPMVSRIRRLGILPQRLEHIGDG